MTYDCENRLTTAGGGYISYGYDVLGRRVSRTQSGTTVYYVYDGPHIIAEYSSTGSLIRKYVYGPGMDNPVMMVRRLGTTDTRYYYYADALGSVRLLTNAAGAVVESYTYDPYGMPRVMYTVGGVSGAGPDGNWLTEDVATYSNSFLTRGNPIMFTGRWWDNSTKLYYYRFRDYSPTLGRFLQPDPIGYADSMNLYAYCGNNPINWIDPWGLCGQESQKGGYTKAVGAALKYIYGLAVNEGIETIGNNDKEKHIEVSYAMAQASNSTIARMIGFANELMDLLFGEGFNINDMIANEIGIIYSEQGYSEKEVEELI